MTPDLSSPELYLNRELSWIEFNRRVLEEAQDPSQPLLERLKFLAITSSNLDEFFEVRVAGIKQQIDTESGDVGPDGIGAPALFDAIQRKAHEMVEEQYRLWREDLAPALASHGIHFLETERLKGADKKWAAHYFRNEVFPVLTPLAIDSSHPFPQLQNKSHNLIVVLRKSSASPELSYAIVQIPRVLPRLVRLAVPETDAGIWNYLLLKDLIKTHIGELFPGMEVEGAYAFRVTRNSDLYIDDEEAENLLRTIEEELRKRNRGNAVRLEVQSDCPSAIQQLLLETFRLGEKDLYALNGPLTFLHLMPLCSNDAFPHLRDKPFVPVNPKHLPPDADLFATMRKQDLLLHHPYENFNPVVDMIHRSSDDPTVLAIKMTLYRTSGDSPVVRALVRAAENGKQVTVLVELKARFDEANNIVWARQLEEAGVHVVYGLVGLKTHCKMLLVVRRDEDRIRHYVHLGTGNYNPTTARFYTDLSLFTTHAEITQEVATLFNTLTGLAEFHGIHKLLVAPFELAERFKALITRETLNARAGKTARIIAKMNSLVDEDIIRDLYEASQAGVKIDLIIRGVCCLRPGVPGVSDNIRVISIVGRFLEHSRIFYFENGGDSVIYLGSADWMPRNFYRRIEVAFPVEDPAIRKRITAEILPVFLNDCVKARELQADGTHRRLKPKPGQKPVQAQLTFRDLARKQTSTTVNLQELKITPITKPAKA
jgi:polyphosphate kinase